MLLIDKAKPSQTIIVTVSETPIQSGHILKLRVFNKQDNKVYEITLPSNTSTYTERYDMFTFLTTSIATWSEGMYIYNIVEANGSTDVNLLEMGALKVIGTPVEVFVSNTDDAISDEYVVYDNI